MAKADLRKAETDAHREQAGRVIERMREIAGLNLQQLAHALDRDERQVARWCAGVERMQLDRVLAAPGLVQAFLVALAEHSGVHVETVIRVKRA